MRGKLLAVLIVPLLAVACAIVFGRVPGVDLLALKAGDVQRRLLADPLRADRRIVLVEVDQASLDHFERDNIAYPWPRSLYNPLLDYCAGGGAAAVLFDILFTNLSPWGEETDADFAAGLRKNGHAFMAASFSSAAHAGGSLDPRLSLAVEGTPPPELRRPAASAPLPAILEAAAGIGSVTLRPEEDGVVRRLPIGVLYQGRLIPGLAFAPFVGGARAALFEPGRVRFGGLSVPIDDQGRFLVRFHGQRRDYRRYSAAQIITSAIAAAEGKTPAVPAEVFRGAYVVVGSTAPGLLDLKPTPLAATAPGFEAHVNAIDNILNGDFLAQAPPAVSAGLALAAAGLTAAAVIFLPVAAGAGALAGVVGALLAVLVLAYRGGWFLDPWTIGISLLLAVIGASVRRYTTEGKDKRFIAGAFARYVSPKVVKQILADPKLLALGGERRDVTLFFSDLQGFTSISEGMNPPELVAFLNEYTTLMADVITGPGLDGTIDKYIGDSVMAFWGAPLPQPDHARRGLLAALACQERLRPFCDELVARGGPRLVTRIGLNSGTCVVGNMGSRDRFDYTAIGDTVNQASRLEGINKVYGTLVIASASTWEAAQGAAFGRLLDHVRVKGKAEPVAIYEALAPAGSETDAQRALVSAYAAALAAYQGRQWQRTIEQAGAILLATPGDGPSQVLIERARAFTIEPPPENWDGVWTLKTK
ncbi:MAG: CHASE2 domain-containing protein [Candidatus Methylomirabilia bacterium]